MTNSAEGEFKDVIWAAMLKWKVTTAYPLEFLDMILTAAMCYAAGDSDALTAARREVLFAATAPGSDRRVEVPEGATLSTGPSVPAGGKGPVKLRPQAVDNR